MKRFESFIGIFASCCLIIIGYTTYSAFHVVKSNDCVKDTLVVTPIHVKDTLVIRVETVRLVKTIRHFSRKPSLYNKYSVTNDSCAGTTPPPIKTSR